MLCGILMTTNIGLSGFSGLEKIWRNIMNCESKLLYIHTETIGFCGCGNPEEMMVYIKEMLEKLDSKLFAKNIESSAK